VDAPSVQKHQRQALPSDPSQARQALLAQVKETPAPVVVVALDGETLFDASGRSRRIFLEVLAEAGKLELMKTVKERVVQGAPLRHQADFERAAGVKDPQLLDLLKRRFGERLTSDSYIPDDQPRRGVSAFFRSLYGAGATLAFISDNDLIRSGPGWVQLLRNNQLPVLSPRAYLMLPARPNGADEAFVKDRLETIAGLGEVVALIHGRVEDAQVLTQAFPKAHSVAMQPISKPDRPGWLDFGGQALPVLKPKAAAPDAGPNEDPSSQP
jgi:hypothetical protein